MAVTSSPIFAQTPFASSLSMTAQTACSTRAPTATASLAGANIIEFVTTSTNGLRIDSIQVNACGTGISTANAANIVGIWLWDGTIARLINEILVTAVTPSASAVAAFTTTLTYAQPLNLPSTYKLFATVGVTTTAAGTALQVTAFGGAY